jgi:hypothetical protein
MKSKTLGEMSSKEYKAFLDSLGQENVGELTTDQFFTALEGMASETVELKATVRNGRLVFLEPAPLATKDNEIQLGGTRIIIELVEPELSTAA